MEKKIYITDEERAKCQKVADAFAELYEMADIVVVDVGRYGFVMLKYYTPPHGFEEDATFTDSRVLFEGLWQEWLDMKLYLMAKGTPLIEKGYQGVFESLPKEKQSAIIEKKAAFAKKAEISLKNTFQRRKHTKIEGKIIRKALYHTGLFLLVYFDKKTE